MIYKFTSKFVQKFHGTYCMFKCSLFHFHMPVPVGNSNVAKLENIYPLLNLLYIVILC